MVGLENIDSFTPFSLIYEQTSYEDYKEKLKFLQSPILLDQTLFLLLQKAVPKLNRPIQLTNELAYIKPVWEAYEFVSSGVPESFSIDKMDIRQFISLYAFAEVEIDAETGEKERKKIDVDLFVDEITENWYADIKETIPAGSAITIELIQDGYFINDFKSIDGSINKGTRERYQNGRVISILGGLVSVEWFMMMQNNLAEMQNLVKSKSFGTGSESNNMKSKQDRYLLIASQTSYLMDLFEKQFSVDNPQYRKRKRWY